MFLANAPARQGKEDPRFDLLAGHGLRCEDRPDVAILFIPALQYFLGMLIRIYTLPDFCYTFCRIRDEKYGAAQGASHA